MSNSNSSPYHFTEAISKIRNSKMPERFKNKLICDLEFVAVSGIEGLKYIILFGSASRGELKLTSDLDLLFVTAEPISRMVKADIDTKLDEEIDGVSSDAKFYTIEQFENSDGLFIRQIRKDGKILWKTDIK